MYAWKNLSPHCIGTFGHIQPRLEAGILHTGRESGGMGLVRQLHSTGWTRSRYTHLLNINALEDG
jgi:hypothetical protein